MHSRGWRIRARGVQRHKLRETMGLHDCTWRWRKEGKTLTPKQSMGKPFRTSRGRASLRHSKAAYLSQVFSTAAGAQLRKWSEGGKARRKLPDVTPEKQSREKCKEKGSREKDAGWNEWKLHIFFKRAKLKYTPGQVISHINWVENKIIIRWMNLSGLLAVQKKTYARPKIII